MSRLKKVLLFVFWPPKETNVAQIACWVSEVISILSPLLFVAMWGYYAGVGFSIKAAISLAVVALSFFLSWWAANKLSAIQKAQKLQIKKTGGTPSFLVFLRSPQILFWIKKHILLIEKHILLVIAGGLVLMGLQPIINYPLTFFYQIGIIIMALALLHQMTDQYKFKE